MGVSHLALLCRYIGKSNVILCDKSRFVRGIFSFIGFNTVASMSCASIDFGAIGGIIIATPTVTHGKILKWAIQKNVPIFVEKPLTLDVQSNIKLGQLAAKSNATIQVGFVMRYVASFQKLKKIVDHGLLGRVLRYKATMFGNVVSKKTDKRSWKGDYAAGGGCLNEYGPHIIDLVSYLFGPICAVKSSTMFKVFSHAADDQISAEIEHSLGAKGSIEIDWCNPMMRKSIIEIKIEFENGMVRVDNSTIEVRSDECGMGDQRQYENIRDFKVPNVEYYLRGEEFSLEIEDFLKICKDRREKFGGKNISYAMATFSDGCAVDLVIDEIARKVGLK